MYLCGDYFAFNPTLFDLTDFAQRIELGYSAQIGSAQVGETTTVWKDGGEYCCRLWAFHYRTRYDVTYRYDSLESLLAENRLTAGLPWEYCSPTEVAA